jgi:PAS domain S-box-containing protein
MFKQIVINPRKLLPLSHGQRDWLKRQQFKAYFAMVPTAIVANLISLALMFAVFHGALPTSLEVGWTVLLIACGGFRSWTAYRCSSRGIEEIDAVDSEVWFTSLLFGSLWGGAILGLMVMATPEQFGFLCLISGGMMCAATLTLSALPRAAWSFVGAIASFAGMGFVQRHSYIGLIDVALLLSFLYVLAWGVKFFSDNFVDRLLVDHRIDEQATTIKLLLNEYEGEPSDWLWDVDAYGSVVTISARFAEAVGVSVRDLKGKFFCDLFIRGDARDELYENLMGRRRFHNHIVSIRVGEDIHWWSLSAHPRQNENGKATGAYGVARDITAAINAARQIELMDAA